MIVGEEMLWEWCKTEGGYELSGELITAEMEALKKLLESLDDIEQIRMRDLEIEEGEAMALLVTLLRQLAPLRLIEAPKMLAHTLYKIDGLRSFELIRPRQDEP